MKKMISLMLALVLLFTCGCGTTSTSGADTIKIAVCGPMTGDNSKFGLGYQYSVQIMADQWNAKGGLLGKQIEILSFDDKGMPEEAANVAQQVVSNQGIAAVIGHFNSTCSMAAAAPSPPRHWRSAEKTPRALSAQPPSPMSMRIRSSRNIPSFTRR